jgi:hypothetical protein
MPLIKLTPDQHLSLREALLAAFPNLCVPTTSSTSCDQPIFVDHATDVSVFSDAVQVEIDWLG